MLRNELSLPEPDTAARLHSERVAAAVHREIDKAGGYISFVRYMQLVLYAPGLGYYVAGARKFGTGGDFVTAPELTSLFAATLAVDVASILAATEPREIVEFGAGSGQLAADLLNALAAMNALPLRYMIIEVSPELRERQRATAQHRAPAHAARIDWVDSVPNPIDGAVIMNEVLDAIPVHVIARRDGVWYERGVGLQDDALAWKEQPLRDDRLQSLAAGRFPPQGNYSSEINPAAEALIEDVGARLRSGAILIIDYGFPRAELYHLQRHDGTLMSHYRHRSHGDPFRWPGLSDLTAHVDFTAIAEAGERAGLSVAGFTSQASYLLAAGLLDRLKAVGAPESIEFLREASAVQTLTSPAEMGELFKVLALARSDDVEWRGFALSDRSHRL